MAAYLIYFIMSNQRYFNLFTQTNEKVQGVPMWVFWRGKLTTAHQIAAYAEQLEIIIKTFINDISSESDISKTQMTQFQLLLDQLSGAATPEIRRELTNNLVEWLEHYESYLIDEQNYARSLPVSESENLQAAGMSRYASLQSLGEPHLDYASPQNDLSQEYGESELTNQMFSRISDAFSVAMSFSQFGMNLPLKFAEITAARAGANIAGQEAEGADVASKLNEVFQHARQTDKFDPNKHYGYQDMLDLITQLASEGDDTAYGEFKRDYIDTGKTSNIYAMRHGISSNEDLTENFGFAERMFNATRYSNLHLEEVQSVIDKNIADVYKSIADEANVTANTAYLNEYVVPLTIAQTSNEVEKTKGQGLTNVLTSKQIEYQTYMNRVAKANSDYQEKLLPEQLKIDLEDARATLAALLYIPPGEKSTAYLQSKLNDVATARNLTHISYMIAAGQKSEIDNNKDYRELVTLYSKPEVQNAFHTLSLQSDIKSKTITTGSSSQFGSFGISNSKTSAVDYSALIDFNINKKTQRFNWFE